jgi:hypothetical protein
MLASQGLNGEYLVSMVIKVHYNDRGLQHPLPPELGDVL